MTSPPFLFVDNEKEYKYDVGRMLHLATIGDR
jgi:hypothetical protein